MLTLILTGYATAQAPNVSDLSQVATGVSLEFVKPIVKPLPPDYTAIKQTNDARVAAEDAAKAVEAARIAEADKQTLAAKQQQISQTGTNMGRGLNVDEKLAKTFIYDNESGNNPVRYNSSGCVGLGQACPGSKLLAVCPTLDYNCEDIFFTNYMLNRYKSWVNAYNFWIRTDCRPYCGHWW